MISLLDQSALQLDREGIKERENGERGEGGGGGGRWAIIRRRRLFQIFPSKPRGRLIEGRLLFEEIRSGATTD